MPDIMRRWFVLNHISTAPAKRLEQAKAAIDRFNLTENAQIQLFAPTIRQTRIIKGKKEIIERPLTFHYVFVYASEPEVKRLASLENGFSLILSRAGSERYAIVSDEAMASFQRIAQIYGNTLPFFRLEDVDLQEGDLIEIIDGEFAGLQGYYLPRARSNSGTVVIAADNSFASAVFNVKTDRIRVLKFAPGSRRAYDIIDAFIPKLQSAITTDREGQPLTRRQLTDLLLFIRRMESVKLDNHKIEAKLLGLLIAAKRLLGTDESTLQPLLDRYLRRLPAVTNPKTLSLLSNINPTLSQG